uniref:Uncharacterized protein n=1 Tax=Mycena chlorophos TaxID=658473 RepID=A0ABQ0LJJ1_MYCCL|nr:predicted protein [Mycena chlorophos]
MPERRRRRQRHVLGPDSCEREETGAGIHIPVERLRPSTSSRRPVYVPPSSPVSSTDILTPLPLAAQSRQDEPFELSGWSSSSLLLNRATTTHESSPSSSDVMRGCVGGRAAQVLDVLTPCPAPPNTSNSSCGVITNRPVFSTHPVSSSSSLAKRTRHKRHRRRREGTRDQQREGPRLPPLIRPATSLSVRSSVVPKRQEWPDEGRSGQAELWLAVHDDVAATVLDVEDGSACTHEHDRMSSTNGGNGVSISFGTVLAAANASASGPGSGAHSEGGAQNGRGKIAYECAEVSCAGRRWCWRQARPAMWTVFALVFPRGPGPSEGTETNGVRRACADNDRLGTGHGLEYLCTMRTQDGAVAWRCSPTAARTTRRKPQQPALCRSLGCARRRGCSSSRFGSCSSRFFGRPTRLAFDVHLQQLLPRSSACFAIIVRLPTTSLRARPWVQDQSRLDPPLSHVTTYIPAADLWLRSRWAHAPSNSPVAAFVASESLPVALNGLAHQPTPSLRLTNQPTSPGPPAANERRMRIRFEFGVRFASYSATPLPSESKTSRPLAAQSAMPLYISACTSKRGVGRLACIPPGAAPSRTPTPAAARLLASGCFLPCIRRRHLSCRVAVLRRQRMNWARRGKDVRLASWEGGGQTRGVGWPQVPVVRPSESSSLRRIVSRRRKKRETFAGWRVVRCV